jgi:hypothetical protein
MRILTCCTGEPVVLSATVRGPEPEAVDFVLAKTGSTITVAAAIVGTYDDDAEESTWTATYTFLATGNYQLNAKATNTTPGDTFHNWSRRGNIPTILVEAPPA